GLRSWRAAVRLAADPRNWRSCLRSQSGHLPQPGETGCDMSSLSRDADTGASHCECSLGLNIVRVWSTHPCADFFGHRIQGDRALFFIPDHLLKRRRHSRALRGEDALADLVSQEAMMPICEAERGFDYHDE